jgi:sporulation protein YlmC with PRC-barrel domain
MIFDYFENKKEIEIKTEKTSSHSTGKNKLLNLFFKIKQDDENADLLSQKKSNNIVQKYLCNIDDVFLDINSYICQTDICQHCHKGELIPLEDEGVLICNNCSTNTPYLIENEKPSYKEPPKEVCFYAYKRINHFKEILAQFQGKETTQIPPEVIENIKLQIKKERVEIEQITNTKTKEILKKLGYNKYYEHIPFIKDKLGIKPPVMSPELEEILCNLFVELQSPYSKFCPDDRVNFLNYYYTAYKLCELLGETKYLDDFPMLKDKEKRIEQDMIWRKICEELDWEYIPTI